MRRRYVLALVLATALISALAGTAIGRWAWSDTKGPSSTCLILRRGIDNGAPYPQSAYDQYDRDCR
jgi:hypothetical protein